VGGGVFIGFGAAGKAGFDGVLVNVGFDLVEGVLVADHFVVGFLLPKGFACLLEESVGEARGKGFDGFG
jgi:hypothetical protein